MMWLLVCCKHCHTCGHKDIKISLILIYDTSLFTLTMTKKCTKKYISGNKIILVIVKNKQLIKDEKEEIKTYKSKYKA